MQIQTEYVDGLDLWGGDSQLKVSLSHKTECAVLSVSLFFLVMGILFQSLSSQLYISIVMSPEIECLYGD